MCLVLYSVDHDNQSIKTKQSIMIEFCFENFTIMFFRGNVLNCSKATSQTAHNQSLSKR